MSGQGAPTGPRLARPGPLLRVLCVRRFSLLAGLARVDMPPAAMTFRQAGRVREEGPEQPRLLE